VDTSDPGVPVLFEHPSECCGCGACVAVCARGGVSMISDDEGFAYPTIDPTKCVGCWLCVRVCPVKLWRLK